MIEWEASERCAYGCINGEKANVYYCGNPDGQWIADYKRRDKTWAGLDYPFDSLEQAQQWCEYIELTGARE